MDTGDRWRGYAWSLGGCVLATAVGLLLTPTFDLVNIAMVYLLAVVIVALRFTRGAALLTAALCIAAFDYLFVPPHGAFTVDDAQYILTFAIMAVVAVVISRLVGSMRAQDRARAQLATEAQMERLRSTMLASISHDLRTPLAVLTGASSTLAAQGELLSAHERTALAQSVLRHAERMSGHVDKILEMARLETSSMELRRDWTSLGEIASSLLERLADTLATHRVTLELPEDLPLLRVDAVLIEQAIGNLLENAARHTPAGTAVRLRAARDGDEVVISVEDAGAGIPGRDPERVFAKFEHGGVERAGGGMGLGLAICRAIVQMHGGRAWAENPPGGGSAFRFALPVEAAPLVPPDPA